MRLAIFMCILISLALQPASASPAVTSLPAVSPDGSWIAFVSNRDGTVDLYAVRPNGRDLRRLTKSERAEHHISWSPDSKRLLFATEGDQGQEIWQLNFKSGKRSRLEWDQSATPPVFAPDGRIVFGSESGTLSTMSLGGRDRTLIYQMDPPRALTVHGWSKLGFVAISVEADSHVNLATVRVSRGKLGYVTPTQPLRGELPAWSPTGTLMAFQGTRDGNVDIYILNVTNGDLQRITEAASIDGAPSWGPDERWIAFQSNRDGEFALYTIEVESGKVRRVV